MGKWKGKTCKYCGVSHTDKNPLTRDHIIPKSKGGTDDPTNIQILCYNCNQMKRDYPMFTPLRLRHLAEWYVIREHEDDQDIREILTDFIEHLEHQQGGIV